MSTTVALETPAKWTWADLMSTYRFWALLLFYLLSSASFFMYSTLLPVLRESQNLNISELGLLLGVRNFSGLPGLYLAWVTTRWRPVRMLFLIGVLQVVGTSFLVVPALATSPAIRTVGAALWGLGYYTTLLAIPALLADSLGGAKSFVLAFGAVLTFPSLLQMLIPLSIPAGLVNSENLAIALVAPLVLGALVLLPVRPLLFQEQAPRRGRKFPAKHREPVAVALLCLVPFYLLYWFYRFHGEAASVAGSRSLLSPLGAVGVSFVPLMVPIMLTTLIDELNAHSVNVGMGRLRSSWSIFLWSIFVLPVGVALVQAAMNKFVAGSATIRAASHE
jgi:hypothetical protein